MRKKQRSQWGKVISNLLFLGIIVMGCSLSGGAEEPIQNNDSPQKTQILFIGNSYTFSNDLPGILLNLAKEGGYDLKITMLAEGGWTLEKNAASQEILEWVKQPQWDYVVLQEQSVIPSNLTEREQSMYPAVRQLNTEIQSAGAETILFMTWGRRDGMLQSGFSDFGEMQAEIAKGYIEVANELNVIIAPVGVAWQRAIEQSAQFDLWQTDGSHPSLTGSYLAACVFYAVVFQESPEGLAYVAGLDEEVGNQLQSIAAETVLGDLERWNIKSNDINKFE